MKPVLYFAITLSAAYQLNGQTCAIQTMPLKPLGLYCVDARVSCVKDASGSHWVWGCPIETVQSDPGSTIPLGIIQPRFTTPVEAATEAEKLRSLQLQNRAIEQQLQTPKPFIAAPPISTMTPQNAKPEAPRAGTEFVSSANKLKLNQEYHQGKLSLMVIPDIQDARDADKPVPSDTTFNVIVWSQDDTADTVIVDVFYTAKFTGQSRENYSTLYLHEEQTTFLAGENRVILGPFHIPWSSVATIRMRSCQTVETQEFGR